MEHLPSAVARVRPATAASDRRTVRPRHAAGRRASILATTASLLAVAAPAFAQPGGAAPDSAAFVTRLGTDTMVVERVVRAGNTIEADVLIRTPSTSRALYRMELAPNGAPVSWSRTDVHPVTAAPTGAREVVTIVGDSLRIESAGPSGDRVRTAAAPDFTMPFVDMVHWPFEPALARLRASGSDSLMQPLLTGARTSDFTFVALSADSATITHPFRGTMRARVDARGRLIGLDAAGTTRKLVVERTGWMPLEPSAQRWMADDAAGRGVTALSGRGDTKATVQGAQIEVDYGTPQQRGREIWGALVPWGELWRTGANLATHFSTDRDLLLGQGADSLALPAGRYTLFSIPAADGGRLIVSRQTGQNGNSYDASHDLGRVGMSLRPLPSQVESFTIAVTEEGPGGLIRLQWAEQELVVPFQVR